MTINFASPNHEVVPPRAGAGDPRVPSPLQVLYLDRLTRLVHKIHLHGRYLATTDRRMQLLNRAALSTYRTCLDLGLAAEARAILDGLHRELVLPAPTDAEIPAAAGAPPAASRDAGQVHLESQAS